MSKTTATEREGFTYSGSSGEHKIGSLGARYRPYRKWHGLVRGVHIMRLTIEWGTAPCRHRRTRLLPIALDNETGDVAGADSTAVLLSPGAQRV